MDLKTELKLMAGRLNELAASETPAPTTTGFPTNVGAPPPTFPGDPKYPGYQSGDGFQIMLRSWAGQDGKADRNQYVKDRGLKPRFPDEKQPWE